MFGTNQEVAFRFRVGPEARIWEVAAKGGAAVPITAEGVRAVAPAYSPDGRGIAFFAPDSAGKWQVWVQRRDEGGTWRLTDHEEVAIRRVRWKKAHHDYLQLDAERMFDRRFNYDGRSQDIWFEITLKNV